MARVLFGISADRLSPALLDRVAEAVRKDMLDDLCRELAVTPGEHVLPHLPMSDALRATRERYLADLTLALGRDEVARSLEAELRLAARPADDAPSIETMIEGGSEEDCPWWMPTWLCLLIYGPDGGGGEGGGGGGARPDDAAPLEDPDDPCPRCLICEIDVQTGRVNCYEDLCDDAPFECTPMT